LSLCYQGVAVGNHSTKLSHRGFRETAPMHNFAKYLLNPRGISRKRVARHE